MHTAPTGVHGTLGVGCLDVSGLDDVKSQQQTKVTEELYIGSPMSKLNARRVPRWKRPGKIQKKHVSDFGGHHVPEGVRANFSTQKSCPTVKPRIFEIPSTRP